LPVGKILAGLVALLLISVLVLPYVLSLNDYIAPIEKQLTAQFKQPVHIGAIRGEVFLLPKLQLEKVTIGAAQDLKVGKAMLTFDPLTLFSPVKTLRNVELQDVTLNGASLDKESVWMQEIGANSGYQVSHIALKKIKISSSEIELPLFDGEMEIAGGRVGKVTLRSTDEKYVVSLQTEQNKWLFNFNAKGASLPLFPDVRYEDFTANGDISASTLNFSSIDAQAFGGFLHGNAKLSWLKGWQVQGLIGAKSVELVKLFPKFGISGELQVDANFAFSGNKLAQIADVQQIDGSFVAVKGVVNNMDMVETVRQGKRQIGRTHFDEFTGNFQSNVRGQRFQQIQITSGIVSGNGAFEVGANSQISGHISVALKPREGASTLTLSGTLLEPVLNSGR
jgi:uncharacterized protein involved in outer membrane biogenesis